MRCNSLRQSRTYIVKGGSHLGAYDGDRLAPWREAADRLEQFCQTGLGVIKLRQDTDIPEALDVVQRRSTADEGVIADRRRAGVIRSDRTVQVDVIRNAVQKW